MKRGKLLLYLLLAGVLVGGYALWSVFGPTVNQPEGKYFYIHTGSQYQQVIEQLKSEKITDSWWFQKMAQRSGYSTNVKPGRYEIKEGMSVYNLLKMLKRGNQTPVNFVINKLRTKEDLAGKIAKNFELDSTDIINVFSVNDSLAKYGLDTNSFMTAIIPNTYSIKWNTTLPTLMDRFKKEHDKFWTQERLAKAKAKNLTPEQIYTVASIIEEETNKQEDKGKIASVYINRKNTGMKLQADPTVKYSMRNFGLKRILHSHLTYPSPYNTYVNYGLPPGPICTPSIKTIDAVLDSPETDYIYFVAKPDFNGYSNFANNYAQHMIYAKAYQKALDSLILSKQK